MHYIVKVYIQIENLKKEAGPARFELATFRFLIRVKTLVPDWE